MVIRPGFVNHWQLKKLKRLSGRQDAAEFLLRLWGACEDRRSQQFNGHAEEIAAICDFDGEPEALVGWLIECEWLEKRPEGHWVKHWEKYNGRLIANWENGQKGGRPEKPKDNPRETQITHGLTQSGVGGLREDRIGEEKRREEELHPKQQIKEQTELLAAAPQKRESKGRPKDWEELVNYVMGKEGLTEADARYVWNHWKGNGWTNGGKPIKDWKATVRSWKYQGNIFPSHKNKNQNR